jgi:alpha-galactosidase
VSGDSNANFALIDEVAVGTDAARIYIEGWQSWSPTGWFPAAGNGPQPAEHWQHLMRFRSGTDLPEDGYQGEGLLAVDPGNGGPVRVYGVADPHGDVPSIRARLAQHEDRSTVLVSADGPVRSRTATVGGDSALAEFVDRWRSEPASWPIRPAPTVWCSWYHYFEDVTEADILENLAAIVRESLPVDVVQIDDGWQRGIGDWHGHGDRFESLAGLRQRIGDAGKRAGIWLAPFLVGSGSELAREHPDWLVGEAGTNWGQELSGLDLTHPEAQEHLWTALRALHEAGFDYFKLDFLYAGAVPGKRYDGSDPVAAYRSGLRLVRDAVGPEAYLLGCGAPILPSAGLVDGMRVSPDTFHAGQQDGSAGLRGAPGAAGRAWQHGRLWTNDADCLVARPSFPLRGEWAEIVESYSGLRSSSDRITDLDPWGLDTIRRLLGNPPGPRPLIAPPAKESST